MVWRSWILLSISTGKGASLRVYGWRQLRKLGDLSASVGVPAARPAPYPARLLPVLSRTGSQGWQLRLLSIRVDADEHQRLVHEQQHDRDPSTPRWLNGHRSCWPSWRWKPTADGPTYTAGAAVERERVTLRESPMMAVDSSRFRRPSRSAEDPSVSYLGVLSERRGQGLAEPPHPAPDMTSPRHESSSSPTQEQPSAGGRDGVLARPTRAIRTGTSPCARFTWPQAAGHRRNGRTIAMIGRLLPKEVR